MYVIFPMAGEGSRFGYTFKPFLKATDSTFIELAKAPFDFLKPTFVFVFREEQEKRYDVTNTLHKIFPGTDVKCCVIERSSGALDTTQQAVSKLGLSGPAFICDCDHSVDVTPMVQNIGRTFDASVATWEIPSDEYSLWGKVKVDQRDRLVSFHEKDAPDVHEDERVRGLIGCHLFSAVETLNSYPSMPDFTMLYNHMIRDSRTIISVPIHKAAFFGTPKLLEKYRLSLAQTYTLFIDIDGTIVDQDTKVPIPYAIRTLEKWRAAGHKIVLVTASQNHTGEGIPHDHIIKGLSSGPRIVINDRKPYIPYYTMADGIQVQRNEGIHEINLSVYKPPVIHQELKGGSGDRIFVIDGPRVRKWSTDNSLRRQYEDLKRLSHMIPEVTPRIFGDCEKTSGYYYDMEYLEGYHPLWTFSGDVRDKVTSDVLEVLDEHLYCFKRPMKDPAQWLCKYLENKVLPRIEVLGDAKYPPLVKMFQEINLEKFYPMYEGPIHGDLTHENIMWNPVTQKFKLIDPAGSDYLDARELDVGKLLQSAVCHYEMWESVEIDQLTTFQRPVWISEEEFDKGLFYMVTHLIRMLPYISKRSERGARTALFLAHFHMWNLYIKYKNP